MTLKAELPIEQNETHNKGGDKKWKQFKAFPNSRPAVKKLNDFSPPPLMENVLNHSGY